MINAQSKISALDLKVNCGLEMASPDPNQAHMAIGCQKDFEFGHLQYSFQGAHMINYMQEINNNIIAGFSMNIIVSEPIS